LTNNTRTVTNSACGFTGVDIGTFHPNKAATNSQTNDVHESAAKVQTVKHTNTQTRTVSQPGLSGPGPAPGPPGPGGPGGPPPPPQMIILLI